MQTERIPAWKRLGLELKNASDKAPPTVETNVPLVYARRSSVVLAAETPRSEISASDGVTNGENNGYHHDATSVNGASPDKLALKAQRLSAKRKASSSLPSEPRPLKKRVSFSENTKPADETFLHPTPSEVFDGAPTKRKASRATKRSKTTTSKSRPGSNSQSPKTNLVLSFLSSYLNDKANWKFNKSRQIWIFKHILSPDLIPTSYNLALLAYIYGLKAASARQRLHQQCNEALAKDEVDRQEPNEEFEQTLAQSLKEDKAFELGQSLDHDKNFAEWLESEHRAKLLLLALDASESQIPARSRTAKFTPVTVTSKPRNPKSRTVVTDISDDSSSGDDSSSSDSEDSSSEAIGIENEDTSSSGSDSAEESTIEAPVSDGDHIMASGKTNASTEEETSSREGESDSDSASSPDAEVISKTITAKRLVRKELPAMDPRGNVKEINTQSKKKSRKIRTAVIELSSSSGSDSSEDI